MKASGTIAAIASIVFLTASWSAAAPAPESPKPGSVQVDTKPGGGVQVETKPGTVQVEPKPQGGTKIDAGPVQIDTNPRNSGNPPRTDVDIRNPRTGQEVFRGSFDGSWRNRLRDERGEYRWQNFRGADVGLWFNRKNERGLVINDVANTGAISKLGFKEGDIVVSVNGQRIAREDDFSRLLFAPENRAGKVNVVIDRGGHVQTIAVEPRIFMEEFTNYQSDPLDRVGFMIDDRASDRIVVTRVAPYSPAYYAGLRAGDVIVSFRGKPVPGPSTFGLLFDRLEPGSFALEVNRNNRPRTLDLEIEGDRQTLLKPEVNGPAERREELREERREDRRERIDDRIENRNATPPVNPDLKITAPKK